MCAGCSAYDNEAHHGDNSSIESDDERYERSVLEKRLATSAPATAVVGSQRSLKTTTSPGDSLRSTASSGGSARHSTGSKTAGKRQSAAINPYNYTLRLKKWLDFLDFTRYSSYSVQVWWTSLKDDDVKFTPDFTCQKSLKSVNFFTELL